MEGSIQALLIPKAMRLMGGLRGGESHFGYGRFGGDVVCEFGAIVASV